MLIDTALGTLAALGIGFEPLTDAALDLSLIAGLPAFVLDARSPRRIVAFLPLLYLFRWWVASRLGSTPHSFIPPWRGSALLLVAASLLQWSKLKKTTVWS